MSAHDYASLREHYGHKIVCVAYGNTKSPVNVALECEDCNEVLLDYDRPVKPNPERRYILIHYTYHCGGYEFKGGHAILCLHPRALVGKAIHNYFKELYGKGNMCGMVTPPHKSDDYAESYLYKSADIAVTAITWQEIDEEDAECVKSLRL